MNLRRRLGTLVLASALAPALMPVIAEPAAALHSCNTNTSDREAEWYSGLSAGYVYDKLFGFGPKIPGLPGYTPQGLAVWPNWNGGSEDLLLLGAYEGGEPSRIFGISLRTGDLVGMIDVPDTHLGGMAVVKGWLLTQGGNVGGDSWQPVMKFRLGDVRRAMKASGTPYLKPTGKPQKIYGGSFYSSYAGQLWAGRYDFDADKMYRYDVSSSGWLTRVGGSYRVPPRTQGLVVTKDRFIFSTSYGTTRGKMFVVKRTGNYATAPGRCFSIPSLPEGIAAHNGTLYMGFESATTQFQGVARNEIRRFHKAPLSKLSWIP
jgi:hypothetical protein